MLWESPDMSLLKTKLKDEYSKNKQELKTVAFMFNEIYLKCI